MLSYACLAIWKDVSGVVSVHMEEMCTSVNLFEINNSILHSLSHVILLRCHWSGSLASSLILKNFILSMFMSSKRNWVPSSLFITANLIKDFKNRPNDDIHAPSLAPESRRIVSREKILRNEMGLWKWYKRKCEHSRVSSLSSSNQISLSQFTSKSKSIWDRINEFNYNDPITSSCQ